MLIYMSYPRPDIACVVGVMRQFMHSLKEDHAEVIMRILRYLKATPGMELLLSKNSHMQMEAYTGTDNGDLQPTGDLV